jgi:hypothetical protein
MIVDPTNSNAATDAEAAYDPLATWVMSHVDKWREHRDSNYLKRWGEYYRLWRGFWDASDQNKEQERSKLIAPAIAQAIDMTVSEMEEATFGRGVWFDISDDYEDQEKDDATIARDLLLCDLEENEVPAAITESYLNGALYGTGIGKVMIGKTRDDRFKVWVEPISPFNFVIDPGARNVEDALGCAHEIAIPRHKVLRRINDGFYNDVTVGTWSGEHTGFSEQGSLLVRDSDKSDTVFITEYHGLVPRDLLNPVKEEEVLPGEVVDPDEMAVAGHDDGDLVEAIVTIANKGILLRAVENPYTNQDRAIVAYPHDTVPGRFWGRGVSEKGYNPQKALDAELRARIDALAYLTYPTLGADATRLPRGLDLKIKPGRMFLTNGRPSEILEPIVFGNLNPATFQQSGDLERMVQMGTGAMDSASPIESNRRNETMGGMSMIQGGFIKRSKRAMRNVEHKFLDKIIQKALWRYIQFDPERYAQDFKFQVNSTMGIMAREFEQQVLTQMLQVVPPEHPIFSPVIKGIVENSAAVNKSELLDAINQSMKPDPAQQQMQQMMQQLQIQQVQGEVMKIQAEAELAKAQALKAQAEAMYAQVKADLEDDKVEILASNSVLTNKKIDADMQQTKIQAAATMQKMKHDEKMAEKDLEIKDKELDIKDRDHQQKIVQKDEQHQQKMKHTEDSAKQKAQLAKQQPKKKGNK